MNSHSDRIGVRVNGHCQSRPQKSEQPHQMAKSLVLFNAVVISASLLLTLSKPEIENIRRFC